MLRFFYVELKLSDMRKLLFILAISFGFLSTFNAQQSLPSLAVLPIDNTNSELSPEQLASLARIEVTKLSQFEVIDPYDIEYLFKKNEFDPTGCYGKICLTEAGQLLGVDKVLSGSVESFNKHVVITLRQVDVNKGVIEKAHVMEFLNIDGQLFSMIEITVRQMYGMEVSEAVVTKLTKDEDFESTINVPDADVLNLSGPRMGVFFLTGEAAQINRMSKSQGGWDGMPFLSQFGYQFEVKYLNSGNVQALFEFIPVIAGLEQGRILPSITVLSGIRSNLNGFEFGFGPNIFMTQELEGFYTDPDDLGSFVKAGHSDFDPDAHELVDRLHRDGDIKVRSGIVFAVGKTFRSGKLNIPVNVFYIPGKKTQRFGASFGFNINRTK